MAFSFFLLGAFVLPNVLWWVWADRKLRARPRGRLAFAAFMTPLFLFVLWTALLPDSARRAHHWLPEWWMVLAYLWHVLVLAGIVTLYPAVGLVLHLARGRRRDAPDPGRRRFLATCAVWAPPAATGAAFLLSLPSLHEFRVRRLAVAVAGLPPRLAGMTVAHVSDLHFGKYTVSATMDRLVAEVNALGADLVLSCGDLVDLSLADLAPALQVLERLDPGAGLFLCEGNHDRIEDGAAFARGVRAAGFPLLLDEAVTVRVQGVPVQVSGLTWQHGDEAHRAAVERVRALRDPDAFPVLIAHHPHAFDAAGGFPLTLAGHTHGGQLMLTERLGAGPVVFRYWSGLYARRGRRLAVSNGIGNWFPLRIRAPAEVLHLTLYPE